MLRSFRVANHKSIRDEQELLLLPVYESDRSALPVAAIYGANASGKSNLLDALAFMRSAVLDSYPRWEPDQGVPRQPFRLDPKALARPSDFVVDVELDGVRHTYGFSVDDEQVLEEWLHTYPEKRRRIIFERSGDEIKFGSTVPSQRGVADVLEELTRPNALFLSVASRSNFPVLLPMYSWFLRALRSGFLSPIRVSEARIAEFFSQSTSGRNVLLDLIRFADLGITALQVLGTEYKQLFFYHSASGAPLHLWEESEGTQVWLGTLYHVMPVLGTSGTLVVDEIDTSLHPRLTARLIALFQDSETNPNGAQLIFTTHDTTLLSPTLGEEVLRRDQVWFTEKDERGATTLYPLSDFKPRKGENTERRYLGGSYGAVPRLFPDDFVAAVRESRAADGEA